MRFVDTNVLLYALGLEPADPVKTKVAQNLLRSNDLSFSVQVLQEFYVQATRASRPDALSSGQAARLVQSFLRFPVQELTLAVTLQAIDNQQRHQISYWDAAILEAARTLGCAVVLSEDLSAGQDYDGVVVENPFAA